MVIDSLRWFFEAAAGYALQAFTSWEHFTAALAEIPGMFTDLSAGVAWPYLISSLVIAGILFKTEARFGVRASSFIEFMFPKQIYGHPSARLDFRFYGVNLLLTVLLWGPILVGLGMLGTKILGGDPTRDSVWAVHANPASVVLLAAAVAFYLLYDFCGYAAHVLFHKVPFLWSFHKIHHSAEVLTPVSAYRAHPMEFFVFAVARAPVAALAFFFYRQVAPQDMEATTVFGVSILAVLYGISGFHWQHSHLPVSYGPWLSRIIISPVLHQIHHSVERRHLDKNFGIKFSLWDVLFGTLYLPDKQETFQVGVREPGFIPFRSVGDLFVRPFAEGMMTWGLVPRRIRAMPRAWHS